MNDMLMHRLQMIREINEPLLQVFEFAHEQKSEWVQLLVSNCLEITSDVDSALEAMILMVDQLPQMEPFTYDCEN